MAGNQALAEGWRERGGSGLTDRLRGILVHLAPLRVRAFQRTAWGQVDPWRYLGGSVAARSPETELPPSRHTYIGGGNFGGKRIAVTALLRQPGGFGHPAGLRGQFGGVGFELRAAAPC
jgi:hypothetical protein